MASKAGNIRRLQGIQNRLGGMNGKWTLLKNGRNKWTGKALGFNEYNGRQTLIYKTPKGTRNISDNLTASEMEEFLNGFEKGLKFKK